MSSTSPAVAPKRSFSLIRVLLVILPALLIAGVVYVVNSVESSPTFGTQDLATRLGYMVAASQELDTQKFTDSDGDLVADPPTDAAKQVSPEKLVFSFIGSPDAKDGKDNWKEFADFLAKKTGKPVEVVTFETADDQLEAMKGDKLHVTGINTGSVQEAVNTSGFVPVCTRGTDEGFGYTMEIIVPAKSSIKSLSDLKGKKVKFTELNSHSGCKAAIVELKKAGLLPERDYPYSLSTSHDLSIADIASGDADAAPVASDLLQKAEADGKISKDQYRKIHESEKFPPFAIGYAYNLSPELAEKVRAALLEFPWTGTGLEKQFAATGATKFVPLSYKTDFAVVRQIDETLANGVKAAAVAKKN
jgi:phosphonate transport system substrate-binding protein